MNRDQVFLDLIRQDVPLNKAFKAARIVKLRAYKLREENPETFENYKNHRGGYRHGKRNLTERKNEKYEPRNRIMYAWERE